jgi:phosphoribosylformylglycinamidine synthase
VRHHGQVVAAIPGQRLVDDCPIYHPEATEAAEAVARRTARPPAEPPLDLEAALPALLDAPNIASKRWVYEQYDSTVQAATVLGPGGDAGVFRVPGTGFGVAVSVDCNNRLVGLDPYEGGKAAVAEAARNVACTGARPLGITDCLNFGNPEKPEVFFQFREACRGIADACRAFGTPVTGGNVSFYNESPTGAVDPTPTVGMIGLLERVEARVPSHFAAEGDAVVVLGATRGELGGSAYWAELRSFVGGPVPPVDLDAEGRLQRLLVAAADGRLLRSAHDCAEGGLLVALAEAAIGGPYAAGGFGATVVLDGYAPAIPLEGLLYGEDMGRVVVSCAADQTGALLSLCREHGVPAFEAGRVGPPSSSLELRVGGRLFSWGTGSLRQTYFEAIPRRMRQPDADRSAGA